MKKLSILLLVAMLTLLGCSSPESKETTDIPVVETPTTVVEEDKPDTVDNTDSTDGSSDSDTSSGTVGEGDTTEDTTSGEEVPSEETPSTVTEYKNDKFLVGTDIPAGEYYIGVDKLGEEGSYAIFENEMAEGVIAFSTFENNSFVTVIEGQYIELTNAYAVPISEAPNMIPEDGTYNTGMYRVGSDIPTGDYTVTVDDNTKSGTYTITNDINAMDIVTTGDVTDASTATITLEEGQYLVLQHCNVPVPVY